VNCKSRTGVHDGGGRSKRASKSVMERRKPLHVVQLVEVKIQDAKALFECNV